MATRFDPERNFPSKETHLFAVIEQEHIGRLVLGETEQGGRALSWLFHCPLADKAEFLGSGERCQL